MITLIHGDDIKKVETSVIDASKNLKIKRLDGKKIKLKELEEALFSSSLFGEEVIVVIENIFKNLKKKELLNFIKKNGDSVDIVLVEKVKINKRDINLIKTDTVVEHFLPQYYFKFLDELYPGKAKDLLFYYENLLQTMTAEQVFYSIVKRIRGLISVKAGALSHSEIAKSAPWQIGKLRRQASFWKEEKLLDFYKKVFFIEKRMKSSNLPSSLENYIDMMLLTELN